MFLVDSTSTGPIVSCTSFCNIKLTFKLKAASVMTCSAGKGYELYKMINKRLDPNNAISEHAILADVRRLAFMKGKNLEETKLRVMQLIALSGVH